MIDPKPKVSVMAWAVKDKAGEIERCRLGTEHFWIYPTKEALEFWRKGTQIIRVRIEEV